MAALSRRAAMQAQGKIDDNSINEAAADHPEAEAGEARGFPYAVAGLVIVAMALGGAFWAVNGPSVFMELAASAWALCF
jgi:hypothetical protein